MRLKDRGTKGEFLVIDFHYDVALESRSIGKATFFHSAEGKCHRSHSKLLQHHHCNSGQLAKQENKCDNYHMYERTDVLVLPHQMND